MSGNDRAGGSGAPQISAVVCTYRREESLCDVLSDLLAQEGVEAEILVMDQTRDHAPETLAFFARHADRLRRVTLPEPNLPAARNEAVRMARAEVIAFADDDLRLPPDLLRGMVDQFEDAEVEGLAPLVVVAGAPPGRDVEQRYGFRGDWRSARRLRVDSVMGACMAFRREAILGVGGFDEALGRLNRTAAGEDTEFCRRFTRSGRGLWLSPSMQVKHLTEIPGGCDARTGLYGASEAPHRRAMAYMILKEEGAFARMTPRAAARLLRASVVRRDVLAAGPRAMLEAVSLMWSTVRDVRAFLPRAGVPNEHR